MTSPNISSANLRIIDSDIGPVIPVGDVCALVGYSRSAATRLINRPSNAPSFAGLTINQTIKGASGSRTLLCLTEEGVRRFLKAMCPDETTRPQLAKRIAQFRAETFDRDMILPAPPRAPPTDEENKIVTILSDAADVADVLHDRWEYPKDVARRLAMQDAVNKHPGLLDPFKGPAVLSSQEDSAVLALPAPAAEIPQRCKECIVLEADPDYDRTFTTGKIAEMVKQPEVWVRTVLEKDGLLIFVNKSMHLTTLAQKLEMGKIFTYYPQAPHNWAERKGIRWYPKAIERIRAVLVAQQAPLIPGEVSAAG